MTFDHDIHLHTWLSSCCAAKDAHHPGPMLEIAAEMGLHTVGFADHVWANPELSPSPWYAPQGPGQADLLRGELAGVSTSLRVLVGCEAETVAPGQFGIDKAFAETLDFVLLAASHFHMREFVAQPESDSPRHLARHMMDFFRSAAASGLATAIAHPLLPLGYFEVFDRAVETISGGEFQDAFGLAREKGVALEITLAYIPGDNRVHSIETPVRILEEARRAGCFFTLGSDAHSPGRQKKLPDLDLLAAPAGITGQHILPALRRPGTRQVRTPG